MDIGLQDRSAAPQVSFTPSRLVELAWSDLQMAERPDCVDWYEARLESGGVEQRLW